MSLQYVCDGTKDNGAPCGVIGQPRGKGQAVPKSWTCAEGLAGQLVTLCLDCEQRRRSAMEHE